jgi:hypothetical protein
VADAILVLAVLTCLGLPPPPVTWEGMLSSWEDSPWRLLVGGLSGRLLVVLTIVALDFIGDDCANSSMFDCNIVDCKERTKGLLFEASSGLSGSAARVGILHHQPWSSVHFWRLHRGPRTRRLS